MSESTLNCYIWVIGAHSYQEKDNLQMYNLKKIFFYNSLEDRTFENSNYNLTFSFEVQLPEFVIEGVTPEISEKVFRKELNAAIFYNKETKKWSAQTW
jgi:hypothetical protein